MTIIQTHVIPNIPPGGTTVTFISDFADFPVGASNGDLIAYNELLMKWNAATSHWIPALVHDQGGIHSVKYLNGDEDATARVTAGFTDVESGTGAISTDGTWIRWASTSPASNSAYIKRTDDAFKEYGDVDVAGVGVFTTFILKPIAIGTETGPTSSTPNGGHQCLLLRCGDSGGGNGITLLWTFQREATDKYQGLINTSLVTSEKPAGVRRQTLVPAWTNGTAKHVCFIAELPEPSYGGILGQQNGMVWCYINGILACGSGVSSAGTFSWATGGGLGDFMLGDLSSTGNSTWAFRDLVLGLYGKDPL